MNIPSWCRKGAKVVCVDAKAIRGHTHDLELPRTGEIYTIRDVVWNDYWDKWQCHLVEIVNEPRRCLMTGFGEAGWDVSRFRPLTEISESADTEARIFHAKRKSAGIRVTVEG